MSKSKPQAEEFKEPKMQYSGFWISGKQKKIYRATSIISNLNKGRGTK